MKILEKILKIEPEFDEKKITKAINLVGEGAISMPHLKLLLLLNPDQASILAYILHCYVLDGHITLKKVEENFDRDTSQIIAHLNTVFKLPVNKKAQPEILRKMFLTLAKDFRVVMLLLVNKLSELDLAKREGGENMKELAQAAMDIYIPIATRLGVYEIKTMMEDVCFEVLYPEDYKKIKEELEQYEGISDKYIGKATQSIKKLLDSYGIDTEISGRMKHPYSIYKKMHRKQKTSVSEIFDIFALRIIIEDSPMLDGNEDISQCYAVLGLIHSAWRPLARRFKDYIAVPKVNGYRSLHTTILGLTPDVRDEPTEIQIRTRTMHQEAEFGVASHWWYKEGSSGHTAAKNKVGGVQDKRVKGQMEWLKGLADLHQQMEGGESSDNNHELQLFTDNIFVLTPNGDVKDLPIGATPVDFAYIIHTEVGNCCAQAKVNGSIVPLDYELSNGDVVNIITKKEAKPNRYWLSFVKTHAAQYRIKNWFRQQDRENNLKLGREYLNKELTKLNKTILDPSLTLLKNYDGRELSFKEREFVLECVGNGHYSTKQVLRKVLPEDELVTEKNIKPIKAVQFKEIDRDKLKGSKVVISGETDIPVVFASCCSPSFGAPIIGYVGRGNSVRIHDEKCEELSQLETERFVDVEWADKDGYYVELEIKTDDSPRISGEIWDRLRIFETATKELSTVAKVSDGVVRKLYIKVRDLDELQDVMAKLENLEGVYEIRKVS